MKPVLVTGQGTYDYPHTTWIYLGVVYWCHNSLELSTLYYVLGSCFFFFFRRWTHFLRHTSLSQGGRVGWGSLIQQSVQVSKPTKQLFNLHFRYINGSLKIENTQLWISNLIISTVGRKIVESGNHQQPMEDGICRASQILRSLESELKCTEVAQKYHNSFAQSKADLNLWKDGDEAELVPSWNPTLINAIPFEKNFTIYGWFPDDTYDILEFEHGQKTNRLVTVHLELLFEHFWCVNETEAVKQRKPVIPDWQIKVFQVKNWRRVSLCEDFGSGHVGWHWLWRRGILELGSIFFGLPRRITGGEVDGWWWMFQTFFGGEYFKYLL